MLGQKSVVLRERFNPERNSASSGECANVSKILGGGVRVAIAVYDTAAIRFAFEDVVEGCQDRCLARVNRDDVEQPSSNLQSWVEMSHMSETRAQLT